MIEKTTNCKRNVETNKVQLWEECSCLLLPYERREIVNPAATFQHERPIFTTNMVLSKILKSYPSYTTSIIILFQKGIRFNLDAILIRFIPCPSLGGLRSISCDFYDQFWPNHVHFHHFIQETLVWSKMVKTFEFDSEWSSLTQKIPV